MIMRLMFRGGHIKIWLTVEAMLYNVPIVVCVLGVVLNVVARNSSNHFLTFCICIKTTKAIVSDCKVNFAI
jgi:hypothetical protein